MNDTPCLPCPPELVQQLEAAYERITGINPGRNLFGRRDQDWFYWVQSGYTEADLALVVRHIRRCIADGTRGFNMGSLRFSNLIGQPDKFGELVGEIRALSRPIPRDPARQAVLRATGRDPALAPASSSFPARAIVARLIGDPAKAAAAFAELQQLKNNL